MSYSDDRCALRFAVGIALAVIIAYGISWPMAWVTTILTASFLGNRGHRPDARMSLTILLAMAVIFGVGLFLTLYFYRYPLVFTVLVAAALYLNFYMAARGVSVLIILLCTLAILVFPLVASVSPALLPEIAGSLLVCAAVALLCTQVAHTVVPGGTVATAGKADPSEHRQAMQSAWLSCAVILPAALISLSFSLTSAVFPLIMIAMLSQKPDFSVGAMGGKALVAANLAGGLVALAFYHTLRVVPTYPFVVAGLFGLALMFGRGLFSDRKVAPLYATGFNTVLVLIGSGTGQFGTEADAKFYERLIMISLAAAYVVGMLSLLQMPAVRNLWMNAGRWLSAKLAPG